MLRSFLLAPCLLFCLACATTPFPVENLEEGMTAETVRENFGEPVAINTVWNPPRVNPLVKDWTYDADSTWTYVDERREWVNSVFFFPLLPFQIVLNAFGSRVHSGDDDFPRDSLYVNRKPVVLYFEQEKLVRWEVIKPVPQPGVYWPEIDSDWDHHTMGHTHHHGHK